VPALADNLFGSELSSATRRSIAAADNRIDALTILFSSPEFQRR
jgi:uncharacterized protein (DUF1800 family)